MLVGVPVLDSGERGDHHHPKPRPSPDLPPVLKPRSKPRPRGRSLAGCGGTLSVETISGTAAPSLATPSAPVWRLPAPDPLSRTRGTAPRSRPPPDRWLSGPHGRTAPAVSASWTTLHPLLCTATFVAHSPCRYVNPVVSKTTRLRGRSQEFRLQIIGRGPVVPTSVCVRANLSASSSR
jgi:hypothetical protein